MAEGICSQQISSHTPNISEISTTIPAFNHVSKDFPPLISSTAAGGSPNRLINPVSDPRQTSMGMSYVNCLSNNHQTPSGSKLDFEEAKMIDGKSTACFTAGELKPHISVCESYVVGYFVGRKLPFLLLKERLKTQWNLKGDFSMTIHGKKAFLFKFAQEEDRIKVLELGSMFLAKTLFLIRPWSAYLEQNIDSITSVPVWINLRQIPLHLWNKLGLSRIASIVGTPIMADTPTTMKTRMAYARVLVEVSVDCSFPTELPIQIDNVKSVVKAEYPWRPTSCSHCKSFGHSNAKCSLITTLEVSSKGVPKPNPIEIILPSSSTPAIPEEITSQSNTIVIDNTKEKEKETKIVAEQIPLVDNSIDPNLSYGQQIEVASEKPLQVSVEGCVSGSGGGAELLTTPTEWTYVRRKKKNKKNSGNKLKPKKRAICELNLYEDLGRSISPDATVEEPRIEENHDPKGTHSSLVTNEFSTPISSVDSFQEENQEVVLPLQMDLSRVTTRKKKKNKLIGKDAKIDSNSVSTITEAEIDSKMAFNKLMGISDHPMMRPMVRSLLESHAKSEVDMPSIEDTDGMGDFDSDSDYDERIDAVKCSFQDENVDF